MAGEHKVRRTRQKLYIALGETLDKEAAEYFDQHSVAAVWEQLPEVQQGKPMPALIKKIRERHAGAKSAISLRLTPEQIAAGKSVGYQTQLRMWLLPRMNGVKALPLGALQRAKRCGGHRALHPTIPSNAFTWRRPPGSGSSILSLGKSTSTMCCVAAHEPDGRRTLSVQADITGSTLRLFPPIELEHSK